VKQKRLFVGRPDCEQCVRLGREYAAATTDHIRLDSKWRMAMLEVTYLHHFKEFLVGTVGLAIVSLAIPALLSIPF
jgi:hypothetical protein